MRRNVQPVIISQEESAYRYGYQLGYKNYHVHNSSFYNDLLRRYRACGDIVPFEAGYKDGLEGLAGPYSEMVKTRG